MASNGPFPPPKIPPPFPIGISDPAASSIVPSLVLPLPKRLTGLGPDDTGLGFNPVCNPDEPRLKKNRIKI